MSAPRLVASRTSPPPGGEAAPPWGGPAAGLSARRRVRGFTLVELLVAISIMALLAVLSWRGLDGMSRAQAVTQQRADEVLSLQAGLGQWTADLDAMEEQAQQSSIEWDGRVLRILRRGSAGAADTVRVVAWSYRDTEAGGRWLRWQSPELASRSDMQQAWARAQLWSQNAGADDRAREVAIAPLLSWQVFFYRGDAWTNAQSSDAGATGGGTAGVVAPPEGVRLVLTLPAEQAIGGTLMVDWVRPIIGGNKS